MRTSLKRAQDCVNASFVDFPLIVTVTVATRFSLSKLFTTGAPGEAFKWLLADIAKVVGQEMRSYLLPPLENSDHLPRKP